MGNQLSGGEQQMLAIGRALMTNPHLLILDEATEGLSPLIRKEIWAVLARLKAAGQAILVIDKYLQELTRVADRHTFIEKGAAAGRATMPHWPPSPACGTATWGLKMTDYAREYDVAAAIPAFMQILADWGRRGAPKPAHSCLRMGAGDSTSPTAPRPTKPWICSRRPRRPRRRRCWSSCTAVSGAACTRTTSPGLPGRGSTPAWRWRS